MAIAAGLTHNCAVLSDGSVRCWGNNDNGQLGNGSVPSSDTPMDVVGLSGVSAIAAGGRVTCVVVSGGGVKCWGRNDRKQLGAGPQSAVPVDIVGLNGPVTAVAVGADNACALTAAGGVECWGSGVALGNGTTTDSPTPVDVAGLTSGVTAISAANFIGGDHVCALLASGGVKCWGSNFLGQLGNGTKSDSHIPVDVTGLTSGVAGMSVGAFGSSPYGCALMTTGGIKCWGGNFGLTPIDLPAPPAAAQSLGPGADDACAIGNGQVMCWSHNSSAWFVMPGSGGTVAALASNHSATCALNTNGSEDCWAFGTPVMPGGVLGLALGSSPVTGSAAALSFGQFYMCELTTAGGAKCWGNNRLGQLGNGSTTDSPTPVDVFGLTSGVTTVAAATEHACALTTAGGVKCWGDNTYGQLANGSTSSSSIPVDVTGMTSGITALTTGGYFTCVITSAGGVKCWWGARQGNGLTTSSAPIDIGGLASGVTAIAGGGSASNNQVCAIVSSAVKCWAGGASAVDVAGAADGMASIGVGGRNACAATTTGGVKCWGYNGLGGLGNGTTTDSQAAVDVVGLSTGVTAVTAGDAFACALTTAGGVKCWGANSSGTLGNGATAGSNVPVDVAGLSSGIKSIQAGATNACAITTAGGVLCWGAGYGSTPVLVPGL